MRHRGLIARLAATCAIVGYLHADWHESSSAAEAGAPPAAVVADSGIEIAPGLGEREFVGPLRDAFDRINPAADGWQSEALSEEVDGRLSLLTAAIETSGKRDANALSEF